jgi:signal transduction histidine kinase
VGLVLIADDEPALLQSYSGLVSELGHECVIAADGDEAFALARSRAPDLVVADFMMPGMSGIELIRALRAEPSLAQVPVILLSAGVPRGSDEAWRFIAKPVDLDELERCIHDGLRGGRAPDAGVSPRTASDGARDELLNWVAHEIKSPLGAAVMTAQLMRRALDAGEPARSMRRRLDVVLRQLRRIDTLVTSILDASRLSEDKVVLQLSRVELCALVDDAVALWRDSYPDNEFELRSHARYVFVQADSERVRQIVDNLVSNAVKYGRPAREVRISLRSEGGEALLAVSDRGRGIPRERLTQLFDRFQSASADRSGHGLGLYIAAALARLHGGSLDVSSEPGRGSTFTLKLPLMLASVGAAEPSEGPASDAVDGEDPAREQERSREREP